MTLLRKNKGINNNITIHKQTTIKVIASTYLKATVPTSSLINFTGADFLHS